MNKYLISFVNKSNLFVNFKNLHIISSNLKYSSKSNQIDEDQKKSNLDESDSFGVGSRFAENDSKAKTRFNSEHQSNFNKKNKSISSSFVKHKNMDSKMNADKVDIVEDADKFGTLTNQLDEM